MKSFICSKCGKELASRHSLSRHKKSCQTAHCDIPATFPTNNVTTQPHPPPPTFVAAAAVKDSSCENRPKNPKIQALLNEIINNDDDDDPKRQVKPPQVIHKCFSIIPPSTTSPSLMKEVSTSPYTPPPLPRPPKKVLFSSPKQILVKPSAEVIAAVLPSMPNILPTTKSSPRTKGDIIGYNNNDESSEDEDSSGESSEESDDI